MPQNGAWMLSEMVGHSIGFQCDKCDRTGIFDAGRLMVEIGDITMPNLLDRLADRQGCPRVRSTVLSDQCQARYTRSPVDVLGVTETKGGSRLGDLPQWKFLVAVCRRCEAKRRLDRASLERRYGREVSLQSLSAKLVCSACGNKECNQVDALNMPR